MEGVGINPQQAETAAISGFEFIAAPATREPGTLAESTVAQLTNQIRTNAANPKLATPKQRDDRPV